MTSGNEVRARSEQVNVRLTPVEKDNLERWARSKGISASELIRRHMFGRPKDVED